MISIPEFIEACHRTYSDKDLFSRQDVKAFLKDGIRVPNSFWIHGRVPGSSPAQWALSQYEAKYAEGEFSNAPKPRAPKQASVPEAQKPMIFDMFVPANYVPYVDENFVPTGANYELIHRIVESRQFFPCYIYGLSGVGKTASIEYACAVLNRPFFRVQITQETIDEDLIGSMKLVNGDTVWQDGPVIKAYRYGGVVVLDECDLNSALMILQPILEKKPFYIKQTGELVQPAQGFQVFATGNTKGNGQDARYIGTTTLNEAFLERFAITLEQGLLSIAEEKKIAKLYMKKNNIEIPSSIFNELFKMVDIVRQNFINQNQEGVYLSTRRIRFIIKAYKMLGDMNRALDLTLARYSDSDREAIGMIWNSVHSEDPETEILKQASYVETVDAPAD